MKIVLDRYTIKIIPENGQDIAFIEDTMGLWRDGEGITLERIDASDEENGFRLETDLSPKPVGARKDPENAESTKTLPNGYLLPEDDGETYQRPIDDFIDVEGSWDGPPYKRTGQTKKVSE